ncbi:MAG: hypothetical protein GF329_05325 [Candidatus Lokiarchaeota archaeon]|nr:hypothetical protein [Candidatus Lokiarchaeota archaeon]
MIDDLFIIYEGGQLMYSWHAKKTKVDEDHMISGFLTAIDTFAKSQRGEGISSLTLDKTSIIFDKDEDIMVQYVITTSYETKKILYYFLNDIKERFTALYRDTLLRGYTGNTSIFDNFTKEVNKILYSWGLDSINSYIEEVEARGALKSVIYIDPKDGSILFINAKKFVDKDKMSYIVPLIINSGNLFIKNNLQEDLNWILLNTIRNDNLLLISRKNVSIVREYVLTKNIEAEISNINFIVKNEKIIKKQKHINHLFEKLEIRKEVKQLYLADNGGDILFKMKNNGQVNMANYIPELISFLTSSKKSIDELYNRKLFYTTLGGSKTAVIILDFGKSGLILLGSVRDFSNYKTIQELCFSFIHQLT